MPSDPTPPTPILPPLSWFPAFTRGDGFFLLNGCARLLAVRPRRHLSLPAPASARGRGPPHGPRETSGGRVGALGALQSHPRPAGLPCPAPTVAGSAPLSHWSAARGPAPLLRENKNRGGGRYTRVVAQTKPACIRHSRCRPLLSRARGVRRSPPSSSPQRVALHLQPCAGPWPPSPPLVWRGKRSLSRGACEFGERSPGPLYSWGMGTQ